MSDYDGKYWLNGYKLGPFKLIKTMKPYPEVPLFSFFDEFVGVFYLGFKLLSF